MAEEEAEPWPDQVKSGDISAINKDIFVCGDFHGDFQIMLECFVNLARVVKLKDDAEINNYLDFYDHTKYEWIGKNSIVIILGDIIDRDRPSSYTYKNKSEANWNKTRCEVEGEEIKMLEFINAMHTAALKNEGAVIKICGNHEYMRCISNVSSEKSKIYSHPHKQKHNKKIKDLLVADDNLYAAFVIDDTHYFCHGGIHIDYLKKYYDKGSDDSYNVLGDRSNWSPLDYINRSLLYDFKNNTRLYILNAGKNIDGTPDGSTSNSCVLWNRTWGRLDDSENFEQQKKNLIRSLLYLTKGDEATEDEIRDSTHITKHYIAHCPQYNEYDKNGNSPIGTSFKVDGKRTSFNGTMMDISDFKHDNKDSTGINVAIGSVFRLDIGMSRAFNNSDGSFKNKDRDPQILSIRTTDRTKPSGVSLSFHKSYSEGIIIPRPILLSDEGGTENDIIIAECMSYFNDRIAPENKQILLDTDKLKKLRNIKGVVVKDAKEDNMYKLGTYTYKEQEYNIFAYHGKQPDIEGTLLKNFFT